MGNKEFGELLRELREEKKYRDQKGTLRVLSRNKLAELSGISAKRIAKIERGEMSNLQPFLDQLVKALSSLKELSETEKEIFYKTAGHIYAQENVVSEESLRPLLERLPFPTAVRNSMWNFIAFNEYHRCIRGITPEQVDTLKNGGIGPSLLIILFDPAFRKTDSTVREGSLWQIEALQTFRITSSKHVRTPQFRELIQKMTHQYDDFESIWEAAKNFPGHSDHESVERGPVSKINHPELGEMEFLSLRIPSRYFGDDIEIAVYVPLATSEEKYREFRQGIAPEKAKVAYFFI